MAYDTTKTATLGHLQQVASRVKTEYEAAIEEASGTTTSSEVATDEEVTEMLDEIFGTSETESETE